MQERRNHANSYVNAIMHDERNSFIREEAKFYSESKIVREFEFADGAVIEYEWQGLENLNPQDPFNHRFTLIKTPSPNPNNLKLGIIKQVNY